MGKNRVGAYCALLYLKEWLNVLNSVQFSRSVVSDSLWPHEPQHARPPCPSPTPGVYSNSWPLSRWCHPAISFYCPLLLLPPIPPSIRVFSNESTLHMRWPKYRFKGLDLIDRESLINYGRRFVTLYRRQGSRPSPWKRNVLNYA